MSFKEKFIHFMQGRYGVDSFSKFLSGASLVLILLSIFLRWPLLDFFGFIFLGYSYFRMFSKNTQKRFAENQKYLQLTSGIRNYFHRQAALNKQRKTHHIYACPSCKQKIRIPRGHGKIEVSCPKCHTTFIRNS